MGMKREEVPQAKTGEGQAPVEGKWCWEREAEERPLAGGACRLSQQAEEEAAALGKGSKLGHVADALGKDDGG